MKCFRGIYNIFDDFHDDIHFSPIILSGKTITDLIREVAEDVEFEEIKNNENRKIEELIEVIG